MKTVLLFTLSICYAVSGYAQFGAQQIISTTTEKPYLSIPFDIDNDGFIDILTASEENFKLVWYRNLDGQGNFGSEIILNETPVYYLSVDFVDLDNDGDKDILYIKNNPRQLSWLENLDGAGNFTAEQIIREEDFIKSVIFKDFDNDGDKDLITIVNTSSYGRIVWYENLDGQGTFGPENTLIQNYLSFTKMLLIDIDDDGLLDVLATDQVLNGGSIFWYKNLGNDIFGTQQIIYQFLYVQSEGTNIVDFRYVDINTDGRKDIVITADEDTGLNTYWFENIDNLGNFGQIQYIGDLDFGYRFYDLDNDADVDILRWAPQSNSIYWIENEDSLGTFGTNKLITSNAISMRDAAAADFDGDGWLDIVSASVGDNKLAWYKNNTLGISENDVANFTIYPNPTSGELYIESKLPISQISVYNILGQLIEIVQNTDQIDISKAEAGVYLLKFEDVNGNSQTHKILKE
ncbi:MAG TPA: hypothetical protein DCX41_08315 [Aequorivita sp.]|nr:hypothetical protein [Aequorivita sp.]